MATVLITGGTGMIGQAISTALITKGYEVIILTRSLKTEQATSVNPHYALWDIKQNKIDTRALSETDHIIHLAGAAIAEKRLTKKRKKEIVSSRVEAGGFLVKALKENTNKVKAVISASAIGWYGDDQYVAGEHKPRKFKETDPPANNFLGQTCLQWEKSVDPIRELGKRLVKLRIGIVLSKKGGALKEFKKPLHFGFATVLGNGQQIISWIHIDDLVGIFIEAIENDQWNGVYNAVGPCPVSNRELISTLAKIDNPRFYMKVRVPALVLKVVLGELSTEVLKGATVSNKKVQEAGYTFQYSKIKQALVRQ